MRSYVSNKKKHIVSLRIIAVAACLLAGAINTEASTADSDSVSIDDARRYIAYDSVADMKYKVDTVFKSRYDKRIHYYRQHWASLIPTQHILQFAGNMGIASIGVGWDYGRRRQWETHLLFGLIPKYDSRRTKVTMTLKQNYIPWSTYIKGGWTFEPLECGLYFNTVFGDEFWAKQPAKYGSGYYPFSTKFRPNVFIGQRITKLVPNSRRRYIKSVTMFYELSTCDIYFMKFYRNGEAEFWDVFGLSLGLKLQLL